MFRLYRRSVYKKPSAPLIGRNLRVGWYLFGLGCFLLLLGIGIKLLPFVEIRVSPKYEQVDIDTTIQVDMELPDIITPIGIVPGRFLTKADNKTNLAMIGYNLYETVNGTVVVKKKALDNSVNRFIAKSTPDDQVIIPGSEEITWDKPTKMTNLTFFNLPVNIKFKTYTLYPLETWRRHLSGLSKEDTEEWLKRQQGIEDAKVIYKPNFMAKISPKMPNNPKLIKFTLDKGGKTSILQGRSK